MTGGSATETFTMHVFEELISGLSGVDLHSVGVEQSDWAGVVVEQGAVRVTEVEVFPCFRAFSECRCQMRTSMSMDTCDNSSRVPMGYAVCTSSSLISDARCS